MKNKKIIKFAIDPNLSAAEGPKPSKFYMPEWFKNIPRFYDSEKKLKIQQGKTLKTCMPFTDTMITGYIFEIWSDIEVFKDESQEQFITWKNNDYPIFAERDNRTIGEMPKFPGFSEKHFSFLHPLYIKTPPGYSVIITQPMNRPDLNTFALTGIADTDKYPLFPGNYPILIKENFTGIIESGTPILQIIPFKRDSWVNTIDKSIIFDGNIASKKSSRKVFGWYRDNAWLKKSYD